MNNLDDLYEKVYEKTQTSASEDEVRSFMFMEINRELMARGVSYDQFIKGYRSWTNRRVNKKDVSVEESVKAQSFLQEQDDKKVKGVLNEVIYRLNRRLGESPEVKYQIGGILNYGPYKDHNESAKAYISNVIEKIKILKKALPTADEVMGVLGNQYPCLRDYEDDTAYHMVVDLSDLQRYGKSKTMPEFFYVMDTPTGPIYFHPDDIAIKKEGTADQESDVSEKTTEKQEIK